MLPSFSPSIFNNLNVFVFSLGNIFRFKVIEFGSVCMKKEEKRSLSTNVTNDHMRTFFSCKYLDNVLNLNLNLILLSAMWYKTERYRQLNCWCQCLLKTWGHLLALLTPVQIWSYSMNLSRLTLNLKFHRSMSGKHRNHLSYAPVCF